MSLQSTTVSSKKFQDHAMLPKVQLHSSVPWKQELAGGTVVPAKLSHAPQICHCLQLLILVFVEFSCSFMLELHLNSKVPLMMLIRVILSVVRTK